MGELWEVYDRFKRKTGKIIERDSEERLQDGEYHLVVTGVIMNSKKQILISRRNPDKLLYPNLWECTGGSVKKGENSLEAVKREIEEEIGVNLEKIKGTLLGTVMQNDYFRDIWLFNKEVNKEEISFNDEEVVDIKWVTEDEYLNMCESGKIVPTGKVVVNLLEKERESER